MKPSKEILNRKFKTHRKCFFKEHTLRALKRYLDQTLEKDDLCGNTDREKLAIKRGETPDKIRLDTSWFKAWLDISPDEIKFLDPFTWLFFPPQVRIIRKESHEVKWHQDYGFIKAMGPSREHRQIITCFVPLDDDPFNRVTLQFTSEEPDFLEHSPTSNGFSAGLENETFKDTHHYNLNLGDCLIFGDFVPHRSYAPPKTIWNRTSFEFRTIKPEDALENKDYFDIKNKCFVQKNSVSNLKIT